MIIVVLLGVMMLVSWLVLVSGVGVGFVVVGSGGGLGCVAAE